MNGPTTTDTNPASPAPQRLVHRARQEIATTGHISDDTCLRLIQRLEALSADERRLLLQSLTRPRAAGRGWRGH
jgi:hypothetical protein